MQVWTGKLSELQLLYKTQPERELAQVCHTGIDELSPDKDQFHLSLHRNSHHSQATYPKWLNYLMNLENHGEMFGRTDGWMDRHLRENHKCIVMRIDEDSSAYSESFKRVYQVGVPQGQVDFVSAQYHRPISCGFCLATTPNTRGKTVEQSTVHGCLHENW